MTINKEICTNCGACKSKCQLNAISKTGQNGEFAIDPKKCIGCGVCRTACKVSAITA